MKIYELNEQIENCINKETGEIDIEQFEQLQLKKQEKLEGIAVWYKNLVSDAEQLKEEIDNLSARKKAIENKAAALKGYLFYVLNGERLQTSKVDVSYRRSTQVRVNDDFINWAAENAEDLLKYSKPEPNKTAIKEAILCGRDINGANLIECTNILIK